MILPAELPGEGLMRAVCRWTGSVVRCGVRLCLSSQVQDRVVAAVVQTRHAPTGSYGLGQPRISIGNAKPSTNWSIGQAVEERADVRREEVGRFECSEVSAALVFGPAHDRVSLAPRTDGLRHR
jgi:hypothetical protein